MRCNIYGRKSYWENQRELVRLCVMPLHFSACSCFSDRNVLNDMLCPWVFSEEEKSKRTTSLYNKHSVKNHIQEIGWKLSITCSTLGLAEIECVRPRLLMALQHIWNFKSRFQIWLLIFRIGKMQRLLIWFVERRKREHYRKNKDCVSLAVRH